MRDADENGYCRCIDGCGRVMKWNNMCDAGHYINRGWTSVKFNEDNVHAQAAFCNRFNEGEQANYKTQLIKKIGENRFNILRALKGKRKIPRFELIAIKEKYQAKCKELKKGKVLV